MEGLFCIGDANGKMMLAHAASAQGICVVESISGHPKVLNHLSVPAACFTHPEVSFVGLTQEQAEEKARRPPPSRPAAPAAAAALRSRTRRRCRSAPLRPLRWAAARC